jgi:hypothetical protein
MFPEFNLNSSAPPTGTAQARPMSLLPERELKMTARRVELPAPPQPMPSRWAALLHLYDLQ